MEDILVPLGLFAMVAAMVLVPKYLRSRERREAQQLIRMAIERGQEPSVEMVEAMTKDIRPANRSSSVRDVRAGVILIAIGLGMGVLGWLIGFESGDVIWPLLGSGSIPLFIGIAFIALSFFNPNKGLDPER